MSVMHKFLHRYTIFDLLIIAIMAALGIALKPIITPLAHMIGTPLMIPSGALAGGLYMMWIVVAFGITGKYGTATLVAFVQALMVIFTGVVGSHGVMSLVSYTLPGVAVDLLLLIIGHRVCCLPCAFLAGAVANVAGNLAVNAVFFSLPPVFLLLVLAIAMLSGGVGGIIAWQLLKVLRRYHLVQEVPPRRRLIFRRGKADDADHNVIENNELNGDLDGNNMELTKEIF